MFRSPNCRRGNPKSTSPPEKHASIRLDSTGKELCQHIITSKPTEENIPLEHAYSPESFLEVTAWLIEALFSSSSSDQSLRYIPAHPLTCFIYGRCTYNTGKFLFIDQFSFFLGQNPDPYPKVIREFLFFSSFIFLSFRFDLQSLHLSGLSQRFMLVLSLVLRLWQKSFSPLCTIRVTPGYSFRYYILSSRRNGVLRPFHYLFRFLQRMLRQQCRILPVRI